jgi:hypothetical protein
MDAQKKSPETPAEAHDQWEFYRDLRRRTLRRADLAVRAEAQRRRRIDPAMHVATQPKPRKVG